MEFQIKSPIPGESIKEVVIEKWFFEDGATVNKGDTLVSVESDKATLEVTAELSGQLKIKHTAGTTVEAGSIIGVIDTEAYSPDVSQKEFKEKEKIAIKEPVDVIVPSPGESILTVELGEWIKADGSVVKSGDVLVTIESDKATLEITAPISGSLKIMPGIGKQVNVSAPIAQIIPSDEQSQPVTEKTTEKNSSNNVAGHPSPAAAKIMAEKSLHSGEIKGTGKDGRITKQDVANLPAGSAQAKAPVSTKPAALVQSPSPSGDRKIERQPMSALRKKISQRLVKVKNETAMLTTFNEVDMSAIFEIRKKYKEIFKERHEISLGFMSFFTKACCQALMELPNVNSSILGEEITRHYYVDMGIAVSAPRGLMVPVIKNAEQMSLAEIELAISTLARKARDSKLSIEEMTGGTFTITNGGVFGSMMSTPILNPPQCAILGMHNIVDRPMAINGQILIRPIMYVALSYDHRIIDGKDSVTFLVRVKQLLEDPSRMLLHV